MTSNRAPQHRDSDHDSHTTSASQELTMNHTIHDIGVAQQIGAYSDAIETRAKLRWLFTSGTPGLPVDGTLPDDITGQAELAWTHALRMLEQAGMTVAGIDAAGDTAAGAAGVFGRNRSHRREGLSHEEKLVGAHGRRIQQDAFVAVVFHARFFIQRDRRHRRHGQPARRSRAGHRGGTRPVRISARAAASDLRPPGDTFVLPFAGGEWIRLPA